MVSRPEPDTEQLLSAAAMGDAPSRNRLLERHRERLRRMVAIRLDRRLSARLDPSDVVQETLALADKRLPDYLRERPLPFYPWLRQIAVNRLEDVRRFHLRSQRRNAAREAPAGLPEESAMELAERLLTRDAPSAGLRKQENRDFVRKALALLSDRDREVLVLRFLEEMPAADAAAVLNVSEGALRVRVLRALRRLRDLLRNQSESSS